MNPVIELDRILAALLGCLFGIAMTLVAIEFLRRRETTEIERAGSQPHGELDAALHAAAILLGVSCCFS